MAGIVSYGGYIPFHRIPRDVIAKAWAGGRERGPVRGEKAVRNFDEDSITMAVAAGIDCLRGIDPMSVGGVFMATSTSPYLERQCAPIVAAALDTKEEIRTADFGNSLRSATQALTAALDAVNAGSANNVMITVADTRLGAAAGALEQHLSDGAAALLIGDDGVTVEIEASYTIAADMPDFYRASDDVYVRAAEERMALSQGYNAILPAAVASILKKAGLEPKDITRACYPGPYGRRHLALARRMGLKPEQVQDSLYDTVGNTGAALPFMILVSALENSEPGDKILLAGYGNGVDAFILRVTDNITRIPDRRGIKGHLESKRIMDDYQKYMRWRGLVTLEAAARPPRASISPAAVWRERKGILPLYGKKCRACGTPQLFINYTATGATAQLCVICQAKDEFDDYRFADKRATITTFSHDYLAASEDPPNTVAVIDFEGGGRGKFEMTDRKPEEIEVGMEVEMSFRKMYSVGGVHNYFWKCMPPRD
jgi:3-hydroxy-3-methylglutaryl CoA synthase